MLAVRGGFIAETEGSVVQGGGWLQGLQTKPAPNLFYKGACVEAEKRMDKRSFNVTPRPSASPLHSDGG